MPERSAEPEATPHRSPPHRWWVVAAYAGVSGSNQLLWLTFAPVTTEAAAHYGVSVDAVGWLAELFPLLYVLLALPAAVALNRRLRPALAVGVALNGLGALVRVLWPDFTGALVGQLMIAAAQPLLLAAVAAVVEVSVPARDRPRAIGLASAGLFAGMLTALVLGPLIGGDRLPTLLAVQAALAVAVSVALAVALTRPIWPVPSAAVPTSATGRDTIRSVLRRPAVRGLVALAGLGFGVFVAVTTWLQVLLAPAGVSADAAGVMLLVMVVAGIIAGVAVPAAVVRSGRPVRFLVGVVATTALACAALAIAPGPVVGLVAAALLGLALLGALPVILSLVESDGGTAGASATGLVWLAGNLGGIVVSLLVQAALGRPALAFVLLAVVMLAGLPVLAALRSAGPVR